MSFDFSNAALKPGALAPLFAADGQPLPQTGSKEQLCISFTHAARALLTHLLAAGILSSDADDDIRGLTTRGLLLSDSLPFVWKPADIYLVTKDDRVLISLRSNVGASPGKLLHTAGGFPVEHSGVAETALSCALRELHGETGIRANAATDIGLSVLNNPLQPYSLQTLDGSPNVQGAVAILLSLAQTRSEFTLDELLPQIKLSGEHVGQIALSSNALEALCTGYTLSTPFYSSSAEFAQPYLRPHLDQREVFTLSNLSSDLRQAPRITASEKAQRGTVKQLTSALITAADFTHEGQQYCLAAVAQSFLNYGIPIGRNSHLMIERFIAENAVPLLAGALHPPGPVLRPQIQ